MQAYNLCMHECNEAGHAHHRAVKEYADQIGQVYHGENRHQQPEEELTAPENHLKACCKASNRPAG